MPPKSQTSASPCSITRSPGSWCGEAAFGPEATIAKPTCSQPPLMQRVADPARDIALGPARDLLSHEPARHEIRGRRGPAQTHRARRVLPHPQRAHDRRRPRECGRRRTLLQRQQEQSPTSAPPPRARPGAAAERRRERARTGRRSRPSVMIRATPPRRNLRRAAARAPGRRVPVAGRRQHEHREPLEQGRVVAGEVSEVGRRADEQRVDPGPLASRREPARDGRRTAQPIGDIYDRRRAGDRARHPRGEPRTPRARGLRRLRGRRRDHRGRRRARRGEPRPQRRARRARTISPRGRRAVPRRWCTAGSGTSRTTTSGSPGRRVASATCSAGWHRTSSVRSASCSPRTRRGSRPGSRRSGSRSTTWSPAAEGSAGTTVRATTTSAARAVARSRTRRRRVDVLGRGDRRRATGVRGATDRSRLRRRDREPRARPRLRY